MFYKVITVLVVVGFGFMALVHLDAQYSHGSIIFSSSSSSTWVEKKGTGEYRICKMSNPVRCYEWMHPKKLETR